MSNTITVRLPEDLADWLSATSKKTGLAQGKIIREQLERARHGSQRSFMRLAGAVDGPPDLARRKGFSRT